VKAQPPSFRRAMLLAAACVSVGVVCVGVSAAAGGGPFGWFKPASPPANWEALALPSGNAVLFFPRTMHPIGADAGSVSAAQGSSGHYVAYLNATPQQGNEQLSTWPTFRLERLREENGEPAQLVARAFDLPFRGGKGSCVIDDYFTHHKIRHFREIACLVRGRSTGSVVVAAAPTTDWGRVGPQLERAISVYRTRR
jgi:hypothetical protein